MTAPSTRVARLLILEGAADPDAPEPPTGVEFYDRLVEACEWWAGSNGTARLVGAEAISIFTDVHLARVLALLDQLP